MTRKQFLTCTLALISIGVGHSLAGPSRELSKRKAGSTSRKFVMFCARTSPGSTGLPGHAFILLGDAPEGTEAGPIAITRGAGFYPKDKADTGKAFLKRVPGKVVDDYLKGAVSPEQCRLMVRLEEADYQKVVKLVDGYGADGYNLFGNSCVNMVKEVAVAIDLKAPSDIGANNIPEVFLRKLVESNGRDNNGESNRQIVIP